MNEIIINNDCSLFLLILNFIPSNYLRDPIQYFESLGDLIYSNENLLKLIYEIIQNQNHKFLCHNIITNSYIYIQNNQLNETSNLLFKIFICTFKEYKDFFDIEVFIQQSFKNEYYYSFLDYLLLNGYVTFPSLHHMVEIMITTNDGSFKTKITTLRTILRYIYNTDIKTFENNLEETEQIIEYLNDIEFNKEKLTMYLCSSKLIYNILKKHESFHSMVNLEK